MEPDNAAKQFLKCVPWTYFNCAAISIVLIGCLRGGWLHVISDVLTVIYSNTADWVTWTWLTSLTHLIHSTWGHTRWVELQGSVDWKNIHWQLSGWVISTSVIFWSKYYRHLLVKGRMVNNDITWGVLSLGLWNLRCIKEAIKGLREIVRCILQMLAFLQTQKWIS